MGNIKTEYILITATILVVLLASIFIGWKFFGKGEIIAATGTIKYIPLEGGFYGIETDKGEKYLPLNLPAEFKEDGLRVKFKGKLRKVTTVYGWGKPVEILEIKKIGEVEKVGRVSSMNASEEAIKSLLEEIENITKELEGAIE